MNRSGYSDDYDWHAIMYRGAVKSAIRGKRGQAFLIELRDALDLLPEKKLCAEDLQTSDGRCCAIGSVGQARGINMVDMDAEQMTENGELAKMFDIANSLVRELEYINDQEEWIPRGNEEEENRGRWTRIRNWVKNKIKKEN